jgi:hypothetical protein
MYFAWDFLVGKMGLGQAEQNRTLNCTYDQLFVLHCTADWGQHGLSIVNKSQKMLEDDGNGLAPSFLLVSINVRKLGPLKIEKYWHLLFFCTNYWY